MIENNQMETLIVRYLRQDISEEEVRELEAWLGESSGHTSYFFQLKDISDLMSNNKSFGEEELEESWRRMHAKMKPKAPEAVFEVKRKAFSFRLLKYAAAVVVATGLGWVFGKVGSGQLPGRGSTPVVLNEIRVEKGGRANTLILSDGSKVSLNAATTLRYPSDFSGKNREVYLDGEACFEIREDSLNPFVVKLRQQNIKVLGTCFNVEAYPEENYSIVTLLNGSISLETLDEKGKPVSNLLLKPGQRACYDRSAGFVSLQETDASLSNVWMHGFYKFKDEPLQFIVKRLENYYGVTICLKDEKLKEIKYTGTFKMDQSVQQVLDIINHEKQFTFSTINENNVIYVTMSNTKKNSL